MQHEIRVGTASWTDPGFIAKWYPKRLRASDRLSWYADHFNLVELNSSFYAIPGKAQVRRWCEQTPDDFIFDVKLHRLLSRHSTTAETLPPDLRRTGEVGRGKVPWSPALERAVAKRFLEELAPFVDAGKLGALLLQLSPSFSPRKHTLDELDSLFEVLRAFDVAVELRNSGWAAGEQREKTLNFFSRREMTLVSVDAPAEGHFMIMPSENYMTNRKLSYLRLHGRNAEGYVKGRSVPERFNYLYNTEETQAIAQRVADLGKRTEITHVVYNNNRDDYAPRNAKDLLKVLEKMSEPVRPVVSRSPELDL